MRVKGYFSLHLLYFIDFLFFYALKDARKRSSNKSFSDQQYQQQFTTDNNIDSVSIIEDNVETNIEDNINFKTEPKIKTIKSNKYDPTTTTNQELQADSGKEGKTNITHSLNHL